MLHETSKQAHQTLIMLDQIYVVWARPFSATSWHTYAQKQIIQLITSEEIVAKTKRQFILKCIAFTYWPLLPKLDITTADP